MLDFEIVRNADYLPLVELTLSEKPPCEDPTKVNLSEQRPPLIALEVSSLPCDPSEYDNRYRLMSNSSIDEARLYTENGITKILNEYTEDYFNSTQVPMYVFGRTNYVWRSGGNITAWDVSNIIQSYKSMQSLLVWGIVIAIIHVFVCGFLLNFLIMAPYCKAFRSKADQKDHYSKILSGQIRCLEFTKAFFNGLCSAMYLATVITIYAIAERDKSEIAQILEMSGTGQQE